MKANWSERISSEAFISLMFHEWCIYIYIDKFLAWPELLNPKEWDGISRDTNPLKEDKFPACLSQQEKKNFYNNNEGKIWEEE